MRKILLWIILFLYSATSYACMPFSPSEIIIGIFEWTHMETHPNWKKLEFIDISNTKKPLAGEYSKIWKYFFVASDNNRKISFSNYKKWDPIIIIADYNDWTYEDYFAIYEIWRLTRTIDNSLDIVDTEWYIKDWWKSMWQCGNFRPDNLMTKQELLNQITYYQGMPLYEEKISIQLSILIWLITLIFLVILFFIKRRDSSKKISDHKNF